MTAGAVPLCPPWLCGVSRLYHHRNAAAAARPLALDQRQPGPPRPAL